MPCFACLFLQSGFKHRAMCEDRSETFIYILHRHIGQTFFSERTKGSIFFIFSETSLFICLGRPIIIRSTDSLFHIISNEIQKLVCRHSCQTVSDDLHRITHSYPCTFPSVIYCYYSTHIWIAKIRLKFGLSPI